MERRGGRGTECAVLKLRDMPPLLHANKLKVYRALILTTFALINERRFSVVNLCSLISLGVSCFIFSHCPYDVTRDIGLSFCCGPHEGILLSSHSWVHDVVPLSPAPVSNGHECPPPRCRFPCLLLLLLRPCLVSGGIFSRVFSEKSVRALTREGVQAAHPPHGQLQQQVGLTVFLTAQFWHNICDCILLLTHRP